MKYLVVARPRDQIPPEQVLMLTEAAKQWYDRYEDRLESFGNFASGGGYGLISADDEQALWSIIWEMPFIPFSEVTVDPVWPGKDSFDLFASTVRSFLAGMQAAGGPQG
jgi:hypothetical protein